MTFLKGVSEGLRGSSGTEVVKGRPFAGGGLKKKNQKKSGGAESGVGCYAQFLRGEQGMPGMPVMRYFARAGSPQVWRSSDVICWLALQLQIRGPRWLRNGLTLTFCSALNSKVVVCLQLAYLFIFFVMCVWCVLCKSGMYPF